MKNFKSKIKQVLAIILSSAMLLGNVNVYAVDSIILKEEKYDESETLTIEESTEASIIEETEIESINSESEVNESNSTKTEGTNDNAIISTNSLDEFSNEVAALVSEDVETDSTYATKRLIVLSNISDFDTYNAVSTISYDNLYILSYDTEKDCKKAYKALSDDSTITSVEVDTFMETEGNDTLDSTSASSNETELKKYLDAITPSKEVKIAILDTGINTNQFDSNRIIDLGINLSSSGEENSISDDNGHGTDMATIIANNSNEFVKLIPIKVANSDGKATVLNTYLGIQKAMEHGADIINISMNTYKSATSQILTDIINEATDKGILVVVSAGNNNTDTQNITPANIDSAIVVSAVNDDNSFASYSNYGSTVDYCSYGSYNDKTGTSYSAANVTGILADMLSKEQSTSILDQYVIDLGDEGKDSYFGNGFIGLTTYSKSNNENIFINQDNDTILDMPDFNTLSDDEINTYVDNSEPWQIGKYLSELSETDYSILLSRETHIAEKITVYDVTEDTENKGSYLTSNERNCLYYEYCKDEYFDYLNALMTSNNYTENSGHYFLKVCGTRGSGDKIKITIKYNKYTGITKDNPPTIKNITVADNNSGFSIQSVTPKRANNMDNYSMIYVKAKIKLPKYAVMKSGGRATENDVYDYGRFNFNKFDNSSNSIGDSSLTTSSSSEDRTPTFYMQVNTRQMGINWTTPSSNPKEQHVTYNTIKLELNCTHNYVLTSSSNATCTSASTENYKCSECNATKTTHNTKALGHASYLHDSSNATCTSASTENYYCSRCGVYLSTTHNTAALGHTWPGKWSYDGSNHWQICGRAGDAYMYNPEAHKFVASVIRNATCTTKGVHRYTCSTCGYYYDSEDIAKTAHTPYLHDSTAATCTSASTENYYCSKCGAYLSTTHNTAALGHSWPSDFSYADSNNVTNGMAYKNCTRCGTRLDTQYKVQLFRSTYGDVIASSVNTSTGKIWYHAGDSVTVIGSALDGFVWTGWSGDGYDIQSSSQTYTFTMPAKAVRGWGRANYYSSTLTINPNGGSWNGSTNTQSFTQNRGTTKSIPNPTRTGYTFAGWTKSSAFTAGSLNGTTFTFGSSNGGTGTLTASWSANPYTVTYIDAVDSTSGKQLNKTTKQINYGTSVRGSELGSNTADNTYYKGYYYVSDTSATVGVNGATVYRIFKQRMSTVSGNIIWEDWNNKNSSRPDSVTLHINGSDGKTYTFTIKGDNSKNTSTNTWSYNEQVPKYDSNGNVVTYTVSQDKAICKEEGLAYKKPVVNGYDITNSISANPSDVPVKPNISITTYIQWQDNNNQYGFRPTGISLDLLQNGNVIQSINTSSDSYTFEKLYKYDENGNLYKYTVSSNDVDRYNKTIDNEYYTITYTFQAPTYSVIIPKTVVLDGINGIGKYTVSVKGNIDNRDFIKVIPDNSFTMKNAYLSPITATVQQEVTSFTNQNNIKSGAKTIGTITAKSLAGKWSGNFNFNIYFEFGK